MRKDVPSMQTYSTESALVVSSGVPRTARRDAGHHPAAGGRPGSCTAAQRSLWSRTPRVQTNEWRAQTEGCWIPAEDSEGTVEANVCSACTANILKRTDSHFVLFLSNYSSFCLFLGQRARKSWGWGASVKTWEGKNYCFSMQMSLWINSLLPRLTRQMTVFFLLDQLWTTGENSRAAR